MISFKGAYYPKDAILYAVFFYVRYARFIKKITNPMIGFKAFHSAMAGIKKPLDA